MKNYLIDSNIVSYLADKESPYNQTVVDHFCALEDDSVISVSILTLYELYYSIEHAKGKDIESEVIALKEEICTAFPLIPLSIKGAEIFSDLKSKYQRRFNLKRKAIARDNVDLMMASSAIETEAVLVSNDKVFQKIKELSSGLKLENWTV